MHQISLSPPYLSSPKEQSASPSKKLKSDIKNRAEISAKRALEQREMDRASSPSQPKLFKKEKSESPSFPLTESKEFVNEDLPYIMTTEVRQLETLAQLQNMPPAEEGLYLGFSFEFNYHLLAERPVKFAWICDINKWTHSLYTFIQKTIVTAPNRDAFMHAFMEEITLHHQTYFLCPTSFEEKVRLHYMTHEFSWLYSEEKFLRIKQLYLDHKIVHVNLDVVEDAYFFGKLKDWADHHSLHFDVVYLSNIPEWLQRTSFHSLIKMKTNLLQILSPQTLLIDAKQPHYESGDPILRITQNITDSNSFPSFNPSKFTPSKK